MSDSFYCWNPACMRVVDGLEDLPLLWHVFGLSAVCSECGCLSVVVGDGLPFP